jgi:hypothetical protein
MLAYYMTLVWSSLFWGQNLCRHIRFDQVDGSHSTVLTIALSSENLLPTGTLICNSKLIEGCSDLDLR